MASSTLPSFAVAHHPRRASLHRALAGLRAGLLYAHPEETEDAFVRGPTAECGTKPDGARFARAKEYEEKGAVSRAYRDERPVGTRRMTAGSWAAMALLLVLAMWVIFDQTV